MMEADAVNAARAAEATLEGTHRTSREIKHQMLHINDLKKDLVRYQISFENYTY